MMGNRLVKRVALAIFVLYFCGVVAQIASDPNEYQWDFREAYNAAKAYAAGTNPYSEAYLKVNRGYLYPPHTLWFFWLFTLAGWRTAFYLFLFLKCVLVVWLMYLWLNRFLGEASDALFCIFCIVAYNCPLFTDLWVGNNTVIEQSILWSAFYLFLRGRLLPFCALIILLASWRMTEVYFLVLLLFSADKKRYLYIAGSLLALAGALSLSFLRDPNVYASSLKTMSYTISEQGGGIVCPSSYYFSRSLFDLLARNTGLAVPRYIVLGFYFGIVGMVIFLTYQTIIRVREVKGGLDLEIIYLNCLTYILILPYVSDYWYVVLIVPTYYVIKKATWISAYILLFILAGLSAEGKFFYAGTMGLIWGYYPLLIAYAMWGIFIHMLRQGNLCSDMIGCPRRYDEMGEYKGAL